MGGYSSPNCPSCLHSGRFKVRP